MNGFEDAETARAWVDIDLAALVANARTVEAVTGARLLPMVKANGYGLGAVPVARALERLAPWGFGVATVEEGEALRSAGIDRPILVFTPLVPWLLHHYLTLDLRPVIGDVAALDAWLGATVRPFHLEVDTGMGRAGFRCREPGLLDAVGRRVADAPGFEGLCTHFHSADEAPPTAERQWELFLAAVEAFPRRPSLVHAASSASGLAGRRYAGDLVRPGIYLYGGGGGEPAPRPVARFRARVVAVREVEAGESVGYGGDWVAGRRTLIATLGAGYADGVRRSLARTGEVELHGTLAPIAGRVSMDLTTVAVPAGLPVACGDIATIFGGRVPLDVQAHRAGTIAYELLTGLGARVCRRYQEGP